jgi:alkylation response protein AidB-like acyl-CoA dehydrogenase
MDLMPSADQEEISSTVAAFLADRLPPTPVAQLTTMTPSTESPEIDPAVWRECAELGWFGLGVPEAAGGVGFGLVEEMLLFRELGRGVAPGPFLPVVLAVHVAVASGDGELARRLMAGEDLVALGTPVGPVSIGAAVTAKRLSIAHAEGARYVLVCDSGGAAILDLADCHPVPVDSVERTVSVADGHAVAAPSIAWVAADTAPIHDRALVLAAACATGVAEAAVACAVAYAGQRIQFGKPIGVNQAIKHRCADMAVLADGAFAQASYAAIAVNDGLPGASLEAATAKYAADEAARIGSEGAVQIHGAIGFTSETLPHRYVYRSHLLARCVASRAALLDRIVGRSAESGDQGQ